MDNELSFETGPIRPPSEAGSYLIRLTRGCPWNRCGFCTTYRKETFSIRTAEEVEADIDAMAAIRDKLDHAEHVRRPRDRYEWGIANALHGGGKTAFLQDGDSLAMKPDQVRRVLAHFREKFPEVERITTYARSRTLSHRSVEDLRSFRALGLSRIHIGMETAHDPLLKLVSKGVTREDHVTAGQRVIAAGMELSEYVMPGLGGREMSEGHARDTAEALSRIDPHFIRLRTLCLHPKMAHLANFREGGPLTRMTDEEIVVEIRAFIAALDTTRTRLVSDHILNLLQALEGDVAREKEKLLAICDRFLELPDREKLLFVVGRRTGVMVDVEDLSSRARRAQAEQSLLELEGSVGEEGIPEAMSRLTSRFM